MWAQRHEYDILRRMTAAQLSFDKIILLPSTYEKKMYLTYPSAACRIDPSCSDGEIGNSVDEPRQENPTIAASKHNQNHNISDNQSIRRWSRLEWTRAVGALPL